MGFFDNISMGWTLGKQVRKLVYGDKRLMVYPLLAVIIAIIEAVLIFGSFILTLNTSSIAVIVALFIFYVVTTFSSTYLLMAMLIAFRAYADGKPISMSDAFGQTSSYASLILQWAIFYSIILMLVRALESRFRGLGGIVLGLAAGVAISVATAFAVPVILDNKVGPIAAMEIGAKFYVKNFGKTIGGIIYSDLYNMMFILGGIALAVVGAIVAVSVSPASVGVILFVVGILVAAFGMIMSFITSNVYRFILYEYLTKGTLPSGMDKKLVDQCIAAGNKGKQPNNPGSI